MLQPKPKIIVPLSHLYLFFVCLYMNRFRVLFGPTLAAIYYILSLMLCFPPFTRPHKPTTKERNVTHAENSPSLCPTMSSVMRTSL